MVEKFQQDSDAVETVFCALESIHAALAVMAHDQMPKQLYKEEVYPFYLFFHQDSDTAY